MSKDYDLYFISMACNLIIKLEIINPRNDKQ